MSKISLKPSTSGTADYTITSPAGSTDRTFTLPDSTGTVLVGTDSTSTDNTVTNKIAVEVDGVTYYLLATTSSA